MSFILSLFSYLLLTIYLFFLFVSLKKPHTFLAQVHRHISLWLVYVQSHRTYSSSILSLSPIHLYSLLLPTSHIYYLSFTICHFRVDTTLIWILFLVQREGGEGRFFPFLFLSSFFFDIATISRSWIYVLIFCVYMSEHNV